MNHKHCPTCTCFESTSGQSSGPSELDGSVASGSPSKGRVDVHHHLSPPAWIEETRKRGLLEMPSANWTPERSIQDMDEAGVATAVLSVTTPGLHLPGISLEEGRRIARSSNEYAASIVQAHPGRFGFFATVPLKDAEGTLAEIEYALDVLKADGIGLMTSYGDKWLGDPEFFPVMEELDRRSAVVSTHPTSANCCVNLQPGIPPTMVEYGTDTTRTIASILFSGNARKFRNIRWIFSHAGGSMPFLIERFVRHPILDPSIAPLFPDGVLVELQRFFYDTAQVANPAAMSALKQVVDNSRILLGTDFPFRKSVDHVNGLRNCGMFSEADLLLIERYNAHALLPNLSRTLAA